MGAAVNPTYLAGAAIAPCRIVKMSAAFTVIQATNGTNNKGDMPIGICQEGTAKWDDTNASTTNGQVRVFGPGEVALVECGAAVGNGVYVKADANGKAINCVAAGDTAIGFVLQNGNTNAKVQVYVHPTFWSPL